MIHVLYENADWLPPLEAALQNRKLPYTLHFVDGGELDLSTPPAPGIYLNRMSPSSHTRGHQGGVRFIGEYLRHLEAHGRRVVNGSAAFDLELSKVRQDLALRRFDIRSPRTLAVVGRERLKQAARLMELPFITKDNQGGKGLGVQLFRDLEAFDAYIDGPDYIPGPDGVTLLQQYIEPAGQHITRIEIVRGELVYAMNSSTAGGFELCPADACQVDDAYCPVGESGTFEVNADITTEDPLVQAYVRLMQAYGLDLAGIEFVTDAEGVRYTYDINGTTNYNSSVEEQAGVKGFEVLAEWLERLLAQENEAAAAK